MGYFWTSVLVVEIIGLVLLQFSRSKWKRRSPIIVLSVFFITASAFIASRFVNYNNA